MVWFDPNNATVRAVFGLQPLNSKPAGPAASPVNTAVKKVGDLPNARTNLLDAPNSDTTGSLMGLSAQRKNLLGASI